MPAKTQRSGIDWPAIRRLYEATATGDFSTRQIARDHGLSETAIRKKAKAEKWLRRDQRERLLYGSRSGLDLKIVDWSRHRLGRLERASSFGPDEQGDGRATGDVSAAMAPAESEIDGAPARTRIAQPRRKLPPIKSREGRKVASEDLIDGLSHAAEALICQIKNAIDYRDTLIKVIEGWEEGTDGKVAPRFAALQKEVDLKKLSAALLDTMMVVKFIVDQSSSSRASGAALKR
jgi:hypothetical protein